MWAAGLFEGEGFLVKSGGGPRTHQLGIKMCDLDVLERFKEWAGCGTIKHRKKPNPNHRDQYEFRVGRKEEVIRLCEAMLPYLCQRRTERINEVLSIYNG